MKTKTLWLAVDSMGRAELYEHKPHRQSGIFFQHVDEVCPLCLREEQDGRHKTAYMGIEPGECKKVTLTVDE